MPQAHCVSNSTSMTYRPLKRPLSVPSPSRKVHNLLPWNKKRCVLITVQWCDTSGCPPSDQISMTSKLNSLWEKHTPHSVHAAANSFAKESTGVYQTVPRLPYEPIAARQVSKQIRQQNSTAESRFSSQSAPSSPKKILHPTQEQSVPPWVVWGGTSALCVSCKCVCAWARGNSGNPK